MIMEVVNNGGLHPHHHHHQQQPQQQMVLADSSGSDHEMRPPKKRAETWVSEETRLLISLRREMDGLFNTSKSNKHLWEQISTKMREKGFDRSPSMCTDKWRNLLKEFKKMKHHQDRGGVSLKLAYYKELDELIKERNKNVTYSKNTTPLSTKVDAYIQFSDKGIEDAAIPFGPVEVAEWLIWMEDLWAVGLQVISMFDINCNIWARTWCEGSARVRFSQQVVLKDEPTDSHQQLLSMWITMGVWGVKSYGNIPPESTCYPQPKGKGGRSAALNLEKSLDQDRQPLAITAAEAVGGSGIPPWNWRGTSGNGGEGIHSFAGRVISVKWRDFTRKIGIDGTTDAIKEAIKSAFGLRTRRAFWLEDEAEVIRSLDRDMPLGTYTLHLDDEITIKICFYDDSGRISIRPEEKTFYTEEDFRDLLTRRGWTGLRELNAFRSVDSNALRSVDSLDELRPGAVYQGL
ncbi:hypothetical protein C5167_033196 [Papaver somniferum]|uniref:Myb-like domain-containing protein n=1 Tax=Papaver somniferum TaxID=3469 RepID=A0A4Y7KD58_PAPSO|nr:hypothetical protein C5167_033196 [Papaver somniferum]